MSDKAKPIETTPMVMDSGPQTLDIRDASSSGLALMEERVRTQKKMISIAISLTSPSQWVVFSGGEGKETVYPTGGAADTILRRAFGLGYTRTVTVEDTGDGKMATCVLGLKRNDGEVFEEFVGYRYMKGFVKDEASLRSGSEENAKSKAVRDLLGLRFRTPAELNEMGLDVGKMERRAEFQDHTGSGAAPGEAVVPFGKNQGTPVADLKDQQLKWYLEAAQKSVDDKSKAKWLDKNKVWLKACTAEHERRNAPAKPAEPNGKKPETVDPGTGEVTGGKYDEVGPPPMSEEEIAGLQDEPGSRG